MNALLHRVRPLPPPPPEHVVVVRTARRHLDVLAAYSLRYRAVAAQARGARVVLVDLSSLESYDPAGLVHLGRLDEAPRPVVLCAPRPALARAIRHARLHATLDVYESCEAARAAVEA